MILTVAEVATRLRISPALVYGWVESGVLPCYRLGGHGKRGAIRVDDADLECFLAARISDGPTSLPALITPKRPTLPSLKNLTLGPSR